jgi:hypothetical protein
MAFDPTKPATVVQPAPVETEPSVGFDPTKPATLLSSASPTFDRFEQLEKEKGKYAGWFDVVRPEAVEAMGGYWNALFGKDTPDEDIKAVADKFGTDFETLRLVSPFLHAVPPKEQERPRDFVLRLAGSVGAAAGDIPQFALKKLLTDDPKLRAAMDYIRELGEERTGLAEWVAQSVLPGKAAVVAGKTALKVAGKGVTKEAAKTVGKRLAEGAAGGAVFGLGGSREKEELESALVGAGVGTALVGAGAGAAKVLPEKVRRIFFGADPNAEKAADPKTKEVVLEYAKNNEADVTAAVDVLYEKVKTPEANVRDIILDKKELTPDEAREIVDTLMTPDTRRLAEINIVDRYIKEKGLSRQKETNIPEGIVTPTALAQEYIATRKALFAEALKEQTPDLGSVISKTTGQPRPASVEEVITEARRLGPDQLKTKWDNVVQEQLSNTAVDIENWKIGDASPIGTATANFFGGKQFGFKVLDERTGLDTIPDFYSANTNTNKLTAERQSWRRADKTNPDAPTISNIYRAGKTVKNFLAGAIEGKANKYYDALTRFSVDEATGKVTRDFSQFSEPEQKLLQKMSDFFDAVRERANTITGEDINPLGIPKREDFGVPQMTVDPTKVVIRLKEKKDAIEQIAGPLKNISANDFAVLANENKDLRDLIAGLRLVDADMVDRTVKDGRSLLAAFRDVTAGEARNTKLYKVAGTALARRGSIPDFLLEKNLFRLMDRYVDSTLRNVYLRNPLERLAYKARVLEKMGAKSEAAFVRRFIQDHYGVRAWSMSKLYGEAQIKAAEATNALARQFKLSPESTETLQQVVSYIPEAIANIQYNIYPNVLGMNGKSHITNLLGTFAKGAPELGGAYGYKAAGKAFFGNVVPANFRRVSAKVKEYGLVPDTWTKEYAEAMEEGLARSTGWQFTKEQYQKFVKAWMWSYSKVEDYNRAVIVSMAEQLAQDAAAGKGGAMGVINKMPFAVKRAYLKNQGNLAAQEKLLAQHINSSTAYNYNRASLAEVGVHLGPFFSTFTKWPTETLGDVLADMRTKGTVGAMPRMLEKYAVTWALAQAFDASLYYAATAEGEALPDFDEKTSPYLRYWFGKSGLSSGAPIESLKPFFLRDPYQKNPFTPAVLDSMWNDIIAPVMSADSEKIQKGLVRATQTFAPGGGIMRTLMRDLPMGVMGEEPIKVGDK